MRSKKFNHPALIATEAVWLLLCGWVILFRALHYGPFGGWSWIEATAPLWLPLLMLLMLIGFVILISGCRDILRREKL